MKARIFTSLVFAAAASMALTGCENKKIAIKAAGIGQWVSSGYLSVKVDSAEIEDHYSPNDKTGLTNGMPKFVVSFTIRNDSKEELVIGVINCDFVDGDGRNLGQVIISQETEKITPGGTEEYKTDTNGYHLNPEKCFIVIKPSLSGVASEFAFDISARLTPERSNAEMKRRRTLDEVDKRLRAGKDVSSYVKQKAVEGVSKPDIGIPEAMNIPGNTPVMAQEITVYQKPAFYAGEMPLKYKAIKRMFSGSDSITLIHEIGGCRTFFAYDGIMKYSGLASGARTFDAAGNVVAEAKMSELQKGKGLLVEEFHYFPDGSIRFYCKSFFGLVMGTKESETDAKGKKEREYYLFWPTRNM